MRTSHFVHVLMLMWWAIPARAEVVQIDVADRRPFAEGRTFGEVGSYERIQGGLWIEVDPDHQANQQVVDLKLAPRTPAGKVRFRTDFFLLKPTDALRGNGCLLYDVNNRGNKLAIHAFNNARNNDPLSPADAGNGFLMARGYCVLWTGWNGDVLPGDGRMQIDLPIARGPDGPVTGRVYSEICVDKPSHSEPLCWGNTRVYPSVSFDNTSAVLTMRPNRAAQPTEVSRDRWSYARLEDGKVIPDPTFMYLKDGFRPGWLYDLAYEARDPRVSGLGTVAVRDAVSFFKYAARDSESPVNPLAGAVDRACVFGISQSGRFIHHLLFEDFNGDERGRTVFDTAFAHVPGSGKAIFNARFTQITRHGSPHEEHLYPSDVFPFTTVSQTDPVTGRKGDWLERSRRSGHLPKLFITETSTEYWARGGSLLHTDVEGCRDVPLDPNVRLYHIAGGQHLFTTPPNRGICRYDPNTLNYQPLLRALLVALDGWVKAGAEPPASRYPRIADHTLVDVE
ncbi:MAG TPA: alpha/beta hydrolase domain-containing protein, partial [Phycisphaerae bacterium]|nr:alpha/beta hydrolase domain-containing protein [Phycisphaerae bacterium]